MWLQSENKESGPRVRRVSEDVQGNVMSDDDEVYED